MKVNLALLPLFIAFINGIDFDTDAFFKSRCDPKCIVVTRNLTTQTIGSFPKDCSTICSDIAIDEYCDLTMDQLTSAFQNMKHLVGSLIVISTKFTSVKFLAPLETIECGYYDLSIVINSKMTELGMTNLTTVNCSLFSIAHNPKMTKLNIPNLKHMSPAAAETNDTKIRFKVDSVEKYFCITTQEMYNLISIPNINLETLSGMHCQPAVPLTNGKVCNSSYTIIYPSNILDNCSQYFGSLVILPENEKDVAKLKSVEMIFGPLYIARTNLTSIDFLDNLKYISTLGYDTAAIQIENNRLLSNVSFPSLKSIKTGDYSGLMFTNNSKSLSDDPQNCYRIQNSLELERYNYLSFDGKDCDDLQFAADNRKSSKNVGFGATIAFLTIFLAQFL